MDVYVQDAGDRGGHINYDIAALNRLKKFGFDLGSPDTLARCSKLLPQLDGPEIVLHPDISGDSPDSLLGSNHSFTATGQHLADKLTAGGCEALLTRVTTILLEPENSAYPDIIGPTSPYFKDKAGLLAAWQQHFTNLEDIAFFATGISDIKNQALSDVWYECYNTYNGDALCTPCTATTNPQSPQCKVDFNSTAKKCHPKIEFAGAQCGPDGYVCPKEACNSKPCVTHIHPCDASWAFGGGIYDPAAPAGSTPWTIAQRATFLASIQTQYLGKNRDTALRPGTVFFFVFTDASCPTLLGTIKTEADFDTFLAAFKQQFVTAGTFTQHTLDNNIQYGAWGAPQWLVSSSPPPPPPPPPAQCTKDAECPTGQTCDLATHKCVAGPPPPPPAQCTKDADCPTGQTCDLATHKCVAGPPPPPPPPPCTQNSDCPTGQTCDPATHKCVIVPPHHRGLSTGAIIGIVVGCVCYAALLAAAIWATRVSTRHHKTTMGLTIGGAFVPPLLFGAIGLGATDHRLAGARFRAR